MLFFFLRVLEECRQAKSDMECSLYNAERRKKPVTCILKVRCTASPLCSRLGTDIYSNLFIKKNVIHILNSPERYSQFPSAFPAPGQEKAAAPLLSNPVRSGSPAWNQKSKSQQQAELGKPDGLGQWRRTRRLSVQHIWTGHKEFVFAATLKIKAEYILRFQEAEQAEHSDGSSEDETRWQSESSSR